MPRKPNPVDLRLASKVSKLYYEQALTQQEISERLRLSRPKVSRLLQQAMDEGMVKITVLSPPGSYDDLENQLGHRFGLKEAVVIEVHNPSSQASVSRQIGTAAASYLQRTFQDNDIIGIFWGVTLNAMVTALQPCEARNLHVVQMIGGLGPPGSGRARDGSVPPYGPAAQRQTHPDPRARNSRRPGAQNSVSLGQLRPACV